ncbi:sodium:proton antiporter [Alsobacter metallidurans]|uniref:Sodium:proton antiporter n=1 Tax=Alsobacter metallidurans TaxID=340221 RepID=A0A917MFZ2_9HYPH|nr:sodium:proton antiporter [Alsobacter metallidurans]GGH07546.1 sodium:proton antiporter [Alsobacter metallidurans]
MTPRTFLAALLLLALQAAPASAAEGLEGARLGIVWALPFAGILLSIALGPLLFAHAWHAHYGKIALGWALLAAVPLLLTQGFGVASGAILHTLLTEYMPFILMLFALFTAAGGIVVAGNIHGSPLMNAGLLGAGSAMASVIGTTGASMILIRPLLRANDNRLHNVHVFVFFIILVSNIGGSLTPLGDPPLFLGFLRGVDFFWTGKTLWPETVFAVGVLLAVFLALDLWLYRRDAAFRALSDPTPDKPIRLHGAVNLALIGVAVAAILLSGLWKPGIELNVLGVHLPLQNVLRDLTMVAVGCASIAVTRPEHRRANDFQWEPILEVAKLFAAIFTCIIPVIAMLQAGREGVFAPLVGLVTRPDGSPSPAAYFWLTGILSSFLDNAPTYLVFFELAGGDPARLMGPLASTLAAISLGAVFMGANTYIGNAPNFMVYAIARQGGVKMPSFFGYMGWTIVILMPLFGAITWLFF